MLQVSNTLLPEACELGGDVVGLATLMGFMAAMAVKSAGVASGGKVVVGC